MNGKVLVVDDDREIRQLLRIILQNASLEIEEAADGFVAMEKLYSFRPDIVILDLMMPEISGYQVCRLIKNDPHFHAVPVIILTALSDDEDKQRSLLTGAEEFYTKPLSFQSFLELTKKYIAQYHTAKKTLPPIPDALEKPDHSHILRTTNQILDTHLYQLTALDEIIRAMTGIRDMGRTSDLDQILRLVIQGAKKGLGFQRGWIALANENNTALVGKISDGVNRYNGEEKVQIPFEGNENQPVVMACMTKKPVVVNKYSMDERFSSILMGGLKSDTFIDMPFVVKDEVLGVLRVDDYLKPQAFTQTRIRLLETFSKQAGIAIDNTRLHKKTVQVAEQLRSKVREMGALIEASHIINSTLDRKKLLEKIISVSRDFFNFQNCLILLVDPTDNHLYPEAFDIEGDYRADMDEIRIPINEETITGSAAMLKKPMLCNDVTSDPKYLKGVKDARSELAVPILTNEKLIGIFETVDEEEADKKNKKLLEAFEDNIEEVSDFETTENRLKLLGVINVESKEYNAFTEHDQEVLQALADQAALALENSYLVEKLKKMALTDELTSLNNLRLFKQSLLKEIYRAQRKQSPLSLIYFDIDDFGAYNNAYLHKMGDELLISLARVLRDGIRMTDVAARVGGEEFVVILPDTDIEEAVATAERFRKAVEQMPPLRPGYRKVTVSIGVAAYQDDITPRQLVERADAAMYHAKKHGKNQVVAWDPAIQIRVK